MVGSSKCDELKEVVNKLIQKDKIYNIIWGNMVSRVIYVIIILILLFLAYKSGMYAYKHEGVVIAGQNLKPGMTLSQYAGPFFKKFTKVTNDKYMFKADPSMRSAVTSQEDIDNYETFIKELRSPDYKGLSKTFCNKVKPLDPCICEGAKGNPGGLNGGNDTGPGGTDYFKINKCTPLTPAAQAIVNQKKESMQHFFGVIPKCCCRDKNDVTKSIPSGCKSSKPDLTMGKQTIKATDEIDKDCKDVDCSQDTAHLNDTALKLGPDGKPVPATDYKAATANLTIVTTPTPITVKPGNTALSDAKKESYNSDIKINDKKSKDSNIILEFGKFLAYYIS